MPVNVKVGKPHGSFIAKVLFSDIKRKVGIFADFPFGKVLGKELSQYRCFKYLGGILVQKAPVGVCVYAVELLFIAY